MGETGGADGIHVLVPIARRSTYAETYEFAELLGRRLVAEHPGEVTTEWLKWSGVLLDHRQERLGQDDRVSLSVRRSPALCLDAARVGRADGSPSERL